MTLFATVEDYTARYGAPSEEKRTELLLEDASALMLTAYEDFYGSTYEAGAHEPFDRSAKAVCCLLVNRVLSTPSALLGASQVSQGGGGYTASVSFGSALGEMYLGKSDLKRLGLGGQIMRTLKPKEQE